MKLEEDGDYWVWIEPLYLYAYEATELECHEAAVEVVSEYADDFIKEPLMFQAKNTNPMIHMSYEFCFVIPLKKQINYYLTRMPMFRDLMRYCEKNGWEK